MSSGIMKTGAWPWRALLSALPLTSLADWMTSLVARDSDGETGAAPMTSSPPEQPKSSRSLLSQIGTSLLKFLPPEVAAAIIQQSQSEEAAAAMQQMLNQTRPLPSPELRQVAKVISRDLFPDPVQRRNVIQTLMTLRPDLLTAAASSESLSKEPAGSSASPASVIKQPFTGPAGVSSVRPPSRSEPGRVPISRPAVSTSAATPARVPPASAMPSAAAPNAVSLSPEEAQRLLGRYYSQAMASMEAVNKDQQQSPASSETSASASTSTDTTGLAGMGAGMAQGMRDGLIDSIWSRVQAGKSANITGSSKPPVFEQAVDMAVARGLIRDRSDIELLYNAGGDKAETVKVLNGLLQRHQQKQQSSATSSPSAAAQPASAGSGGQVPPQPPRPPAGGGDEPPDGDDDSSNDDSQKRQPIDPAQAAAPIGDSPVPPAGGSDGGQTQAGTRARGKRRGSQSQPAFNPRAVFRNLVFGKRGIARNLLATIGRRQAGRQAMRKFGLRPGGMGGRLLGGLGAGYVARRTVSAGVSSGVNNLGGNTPSSQVAGQVAGGAAGLAVGGAVAGGLIAGGPVGLAVAGVAGVFGVLIATGVALAGMFKNLAETINEGNRFLGRYNGNIAAAFARQDINQMRLDRQTANETQGSTTMLTDAVIDMQNALHPFSRDIRTGVNVLATLAARTVGVMGAIYEGLREWIPGFGSTLDAIEKNTRKDDRGGIPVEVMAAFKARPNDPFAGLRQPINPQWEIRP